MAFIKLTEAFYTTPREPTQSIRLENDISFIKTPHSECAIPSLNLVNLYTLNQDPSGLNLD